MTRTDPQAGGRKRHTVTQSDLTARYTRLWLVALLLFTVALSAGALFIKHELEAVRATFLSMVKSQVGTDFNVSSVTVSGLRGFKVANLETALPIPDGPAVHVFVPEAVLNLNLVDLFSRRISIESVDVTGAILTVEDAGEWLEKQATGGKGPSLVSSFVPSRFTGRDCTLRLRTTPESSVVSITDLDLDLERRAESGWVQAEFSGAVNGRPEGAFSADYQSSGQDEFHFRIETGEVQPDDIAQFWPAVHEHVVAGRITPVITIDRLGDTLAASVEADFAEVLATNQPDYVPALGGHLHAQGTYNGADEALKISFARITSDQLEATLSGDVRFDGEAPEFDLRLDGQSAEAQPILESILKDPLEPYGSLVFTMSDACHVSGSITGVPDAITGAFSATVSGGHVQYKPAKAEWPAADLQLGRVEAQWDMTTKKPKVFMRVQDGTLDHAKYDVHASNLAGMLTLDGAMLQVEPLTAFVKDQSFMLEGQYDVEKKQGQIGFYGTLARIEETPLATFIKDTQLSGTAGVRGDVEIKGDHLDVKGDVDATGLRIDHKWWLSKPAGLGLTGKVDMQVDAKKSVTFVADSVAAGSDLRSELQLRWVEGRWRISDSLLTSSKLDVMTAGMCLPIGYRIVGGTVRDASYKWQRDWESPAPDSWHASYAGVIDEIQLKAKDAELPIVLKGVTVSGGLTEGDNPTGSIVLAVEEGVMPPFGKVWFGPFDRDLEAYPPEERYWTYDLSAATLEVQPWHGANFKGSAFSTLSEFGLTAYSATVDGGQIEGMYRSNRNDNTYSARNAWQDVPAKYFLDHLKLPYVFSGPMSGDVTYSQDRDDPSTLEGSGGFAMKNGRFSADFLLTQLQEQFEGASALPPSLAFSSLDVDLAFQNDVVMTPSIVLQSDALKLEGNGQFVIGGDMDYEVKMAIAPETAERIPALRENFNIAGHKISQQSIELAFKVTGPTLSPRSQIAGTPPVHVTLVSGALEAANEALRVIDAPRKILVDLLKIGGGIVGSRRSADGNS